MLQKIQIIDAIRGMRIIAKKEDFTKILKEYGYTDEQIETLWVKKPNDLNELKLRQVAINMTPFKNTIASA